MASDAFSTPRAQLLDFFGADRVSEKQLADGRYVFRIKDVPLPPGCRPGTTPVLVVYSNPAATPEVFVDQGIILATGKAPRNMNRQTVDGEALASFSANYPWNPAEGVSLYVMRRLWRFRQPD